MELSDRADYAVANMLQSIENARTYTSYIGQDVPELRWELDEMLQRFKKRVEKKIYKYFITD